MRSNQIGGYAIFEMRITRRKTKLTSLSDEEVGKVIKYIEQHIGQGDRHDDL